jgi:hypothetical protein
VIGSLRGFDHFERKTFQECTRGSGFPFSDEEVESAAAFMHRSLRLNPKDRTAARDLLDDPWLLS